MGDSFVSNAVRADIIVFSAHPSFLADSSVHKAAGGKPLFYLGYLADPTPGVPPTCPSVFHLFMLHIILFKLVMSKH